MNVQFNISIPSEGKTCEFSLPTQIVGGRQYVLLNLNLRHPNYQFSSSSSPIVGRFNLQEINDFRTDLSRFVSAYDNLPYGPATVESLVGILVSVCGEHIRKFGRLFYNDLLLYADVYAQMFYVLSENIEYTRELYGASIDAVKEAYSTKILA